MSFLLGLPIFRGYVKFQGCIPKPFLLQAHAGPNHDRAAHHAADGRGNGERGGRNYKKLGSTEQVDQWIGSMTRINGL